MCFNIANLARLQAARASRRDHGMLLFPGIGGAFAPAVPDGNLATAEVGYVANAFAGTGADFIADGGFVNDVFLAGNTIFPTVGGGTQRPSPSDAALVRCPNCGDWISITQPYSNCPNCSGESTKK
ncbi:uncharacterized protein SCHCODRAFT_02690942 [Schizophyllum commune H4-8]|uniref:Uncharacterized protein n=1 Tax=Schizophyllum commune (strain H4-8 / FGSC 9210) TaxID=578458 RepID=D8QBD5_SCHCM|nr:uncharacterized protein SCHCODRAFT_02690942 [Schizophyllum commune H4-8]KAI5889132.1 hypothetical protein SCHCODRAFT_02690942 [Schizophyllum commune H4-8]